MNLYRQGDVCLIEVLTIPDGGKSIQCDQNRIVLAYGEVTGHAHVITMPAIKWIGVNEDRYLDAPTSFQITHEEHLPVCVPAGRFRVIYQREYSPQEIRRVTD